MRVSDLPPPARSRPWPSPLPIALGALVVLLALRTGDLVGPLDLPAAFTLPATAVAGAAAEPDPAVVEALATIAPAAAAPSDDAANVGDQLDRLVQPAAGPLDRAGDPLQPEPFLQERRELARQQEALAVRQLALEVAENRLRAHVERLETLKVEVEALIQQVNEEDQARLEALVQLYERMRPKQAAAIFDSLDFAVLVPLALRMRDMKLAPILGAMETRVARDLTAEIARRREAELLASAQDLLR